VAVGIGLKNNRGGRFEKAAVSASVTLNGAAKWRGGKYLEGVAIVVIGWRKEEKWRIYREERNAHASLRSRQQTRRQHSISAIAGSALHINAAAARLQRNQRS